MATTITPERQAIHEQLQMVLAGHPVVPALAALTDSLASIAGFVSDDLQSAEQLLDRLLPDMKASMRENWGLILEAREMANARGHS